MPNCNHKEYDPRCRLCVVHQRKNPPVHPVKPTTPIPEAGICVLMQSKGVGDLLCGTTTMQGLRNDFPDTPLSYCVPIGNEKWGDFFPQWRTVNIPPRGSRIFDLYATYKKELQQHTARYLNYANAAFTKPRLPEIKLSDDDLAFGHNYENVVALCPFSAHQSRSWPLKCWRFLEMMLVDKGHRVVILDSTNQGGRCNKFTSEKLIKQAPSRVAAVVRSAAVTVGNDSAVSHLCGVVQSKCVTLVGQVDAEKVYGFYPTVKTIQAPLPCGKCYFAGDWYTQECRTHCLNLASIRPDEVMDAIVSIM